MITRIVGTSGVEVSALGLGCICHQFVQQSRIRVRQLR